MSAAPRATPESRSAGTGWRWWDALAGLLLAAAVTIVAFVPARSVSRPALPPISINTLEGGEQVAVIDAAQLRSACRDAGLPHPPDLNGLDIVPAQRVLEKMREWIDERSGDAVGRLGQLYLALNETEAALDCFIAAEALGREQAKWTYLIGVQCQLLGREEEAIAALERAAVSDPDYLTTYARLGQLYLERGELDRAEQNYQTLQRLQPAHSITWKGLGRIALARGDVEGAVRHFRTAIEKAQNDFLAFRLLSQALARAGLDEEAREAARLSEQFPKYQGWLAFDPRLREAHALVRTQGHLGSEVSNAIERGELERAIALGTELSARRPADADVLGTLAGAYAQLGKLPEARRAADKALALKPRSANILRVHAEVALSQQDYAASRRSIDALLAAQPDSARGHELLGRLLFVNGLRAEGVASVRKALELAPESPELRAVLIEMLRQAGAQVDAVVALRRWLRENPRDEWAAGQLRALGEQP